MLSELLDLSNYSCFWSSPRVSIKQPDVLQIQCSLLTANQISGVIMDFVPIRVSTLRGDQKVDFDAFVKINDKHVLYIRKGDSFEGERLTRLKTKKLKKMFIYANEEELYRTYLSRNIEMAYDKKGGKSIQNRAEIIQGSQQANTEAVMENPENELAYAEARDAAAKFAQFLQQEDQALTSIMNIENVDQNIAHHGVTVSTLSVTLAKQLGITDPKQTQMLTLGALLHDFDHFHNGLNIARPLSAFSKEELAAYKRHPLSGGQRVQDKKHFDTQVLNIITQHEEYINGTGFPSGLTEKQLDPLSIIVGTCNALDRMITFEGIERKVAAKELVINSVGRYPLNYLQTLSKIIQTNT